MKVTGISGYEVERIVNQVSLDEWGGNIYAEVSGATFGPRAGNRCSFVLRRRDKDGPGVRYSASLTKNGNRRRTVGACWHAHRDVLAALFRLHPHARVRTVLADYRGLSHFEEWFPRTYDKNAGSMMNPVSFGTLCDCAEDVDQAEAGSGYETRSSIAHVPSVATSNFSRVAALADEELEAWGEILRNAQTKKSK